MICAALAEWLVEHYFAGSGPLVKLLFGGAVLGVAYTALFGLASMRNGLAMAGKR